MKIGWFDLETTGFLKPEHDIVEIGLVIWDSETREISYKNDIICKPRRPMSPKVISIHGITNEMAFAGYDWEKVAPRLLERFAACDAYGGQNIDRFDLPFLRMALGRIELALVEKPSIDILKIARTLIPKDKIQGKSLSVLARYLGVEDDNAEHRALDDTIRTLNIFEAMLERWPDLRVEDLIMGQINSRGDRESLDLFQDTFDGWPNYRN